MRQTLTLALALALTGLAGSASAVTYVGGAMGGALNPQVTVNTTWCDAVNTGPIILEEPVFVKSGATLTINPGCIVRGQPRSAAVQMGVIAGSPGALIVTQTGKINAVGTATNPIIFTTAAIDQNGDHVPDVCGGFLCRYTGVEVLLDNDPLNQPLAPLRPNGVANVSMWGGIVLLGNAPTNQSNFAGVGHGKGLIEGLTVPGYPAADATFGGVDPHDDTGTMRYVSARHGGDELGEGNELNCISLSGVGDGTDFSYVECAMNFDDGFEFFGGTVRTHHLMGTYIGDDTFDLDQGHTGVHQFWYAVQATFNEDSGANYGSQSGDKGGEWDGDDYIFDPGSPDLHNLSTRFQVNSIPGPVAAVENTPWPLSNPAIYNLTIMGPKPNTGDPANPAVSPMVVSKRGIDMRNGFAGKLFNSLVHNTTGPGLDVRDGDGGAPGFNACTGADAADATADDNVGRGLIAVLATTFRNVGANGTCETKALANGDAIRVGLGAPAGATSANVIQAVAPFTTPRMVQDFTAINPHGNALGKLSAAIGTPLDPDPGAGLVGVGGGVPPQPGLDGAATYRGAFEKNQPNWTTGWTTLNKAGLLVN